MHALWTIELLGGLSLRQGDARITRFRSYKTGALLAYLAYHREKAHPREALIALLWPESDLALGQQNLRTALASLRRQLEPPGSVAGSVLLADRLLEAAPPLSPKRNACSPPRST